MLFICAKFQGKPDCTIKSYNNFASVRKEKSKPPNPLKKKKIKQKFDNPYLMNDYYKLIKIQCVVSPRWQVATMQILRAFLKES